LIKRQGCAYTIYGTAHNATRIARALSYWYQPFRADCMKIMCTAFYAHGRRCSALHAKQYALIYKAWNFFIKMFKPLFERAAYKFWQELIEVSRHGARQA